MLQFIGCTVITKEAVTRIANPNHIRNHWAGVKANSYLHCAHLRAIWVYGCTLCCGYRVQ